LPLKLRTDLAASLGQFTILSPVEYSFAGEAPIDVRLAPAGAPWIAPVQTAADDALTRAVQATLYERCYARRLGADLARRGQAGDAGDLPRVLSAHGYAPAAQGTVIRLRNCPFHHLAQRHRELVCGMNLALIGGMLDGLRLPGWQPVLDPLPGHCCVAIEEHHPSTEEPQP